MIRLDLGQAPKELTVALDEQRQTAIAAFDAYGPGSAELNALLDRGYQHVKETLFLRQHKKCAYCERRPGLEHQPVEHFRPKKYAERALPDEPSVQDIERYWWLAWTWDNLLFACQTCNGKAHKGNRFPLTPATEPLVAPTRPSKGVIDDACFDVEAESALLLDPRRDDPLDHLCWKVVDRRLACKLWSWCLVSKTPRGWATDRIVGLWKRDDDVTSYFRRHVWPRANQVLARLDASQVVEAIDQWDALARDLLDPGEDFRAASWCMLVELQRLPALSQAGLRSPERPACVSVLHDGD